MNPDGGNLLQLTHSTAPAASMSPDGKWVIYMSSGTLFKVPIEGGQPVRLQQCSGRFERVARRQTHCVLRSRQEHLGNCLEFFQDGSVIKRFEVGSHSLNNTSLKWTPDGKALLYSVSSDGVANIWTQPLDGSPAKQITDFKADGIFRFDVSRWQET